jgi:hypothetical protein
MPTQPQPVIWSPTYQPTIAVSAPLTVPGPGHSRRGGTPSGFRHRGRLGIRRRSPPLGPSVSSRSLIRRPAVLKVWVDTHGVTTAGDGAGGTAWLPAHEAVRSSPTAGCGGAPIGSATRRTSTRWPCQHPSRRCSRPTSAARTRCYPSSTLPRSRRRPKAGPSDRAATPWRRAGKPARQVGPALTVGGSGPRGPPASLGLPSVNALPPRLTT